MAQDPGTLWTLQQFTTLAGRPWYALQQHSDAGIRHQLTGYRHEMEARARELRITPQELPPTTEEAFFHRGMADREVSPQDDSDEGRFLARAQRLPTRHER